MSEITKITKDGIEKSLPAIIIVDGCEVHVSTVEQAAAFGWSEVVAPPPEPMTPEQITARRKEAKAAISDAADRYVNHEANAPLQDELRILAALPDPNQMVMAILAWGRAVFRDAEIRKAQVDAGLVDDGNYIPMLDFSMHGEKPHTVGELWLAGVIEL